MTKREKEVRELIKSIEQAYAHCYNIAAEPLSDLTAILEYELHFQPVNPRMGSETMNEGRQTGLLFGELAEKWGIELDFLIELVADHCRKLEETPPEPDEPTKRQERIGEFRERVEEAYMSDPRVYSGSFCEILCHELHGHPVNPRMTQQSPNNGCCTGLTFKELARKWGISTATLGDLISECYLGYL